MGLLEAAILRFTVDPTIGIYMIASKCSRNHIISEKYKRVQSSKLHFLQNIPLVQLYTFDFKDVGNVPRNHFIKNVFSSSVAFLIMPVKSQKRRPFSADFSRGNR